MCVTVTEVGFREVLVSDAVLIPLLIRTRHSRTRVEYADMSISCLAARVDDKNGLPVGTSKTLGSFIRP